jgi:Uma2 family endonuclease
MLQSLAMSVLLEPSAHAPAPEQPSMLVLENVSWKTYESLLRDTQEQRLRITYDQGRMSVMSPLPKHEWIKVVVGRMIGIMALELNIPMCSLGQTTWKRRDLLKGLEADECFYIQHEPQVRGRDDLDLNSDPPPDLVIEVDITHHPMDRAAIYAALGVPEVWQFDGTRVKAMKLEGGKYVPIETSPAFPFLRAVELERLLMMRASGDETGAMRAFRDWVVQLPR